MLLTLGNDVSDVDSLFDSFDDFDALITRAKQSDIKIIIDQVLSHTSDQHAWFEESRQDKTNRKADWYRASAFYSPDSSRVER